MSYRDELKERYANPRPSQRLNEWLDIVERGDLTHSMVIELVAERDSLQVECGKLLNDNERVKELLSERSQARRQLAVITQERDTWHSDWGMYINAWARELGLVIPKTHLIDSLVLTTRQIRTELASLKEQMRIRIEAEKRHPRAWKLMLKDKPFLVVANDEPYYLKVYSMIRKQEKEDGRWTDEDETYYREAMNQSTNAA